MKKRVIFGAAAVLAAAVLLLCRPGERGAVAIQPPGLTVVCGEEEISAWMGSCQWRWPDGDGMCSAVSDAPHPLDVMGDLPVVHGEAGDELVLAFDGVPDKADVIYYRVDGADITACLMGELSSGSRLTLPENCSGTIWVVCGKWETGESRGQVEYAFYIQ